MIVHTVPESIARVRLTEKVATLSLIHPPALSPTVWRPLASLLERAGHRVAVPDYTGELTHATGWWRRATAACTQVTDDLLGSPSAGSAQQDGPRAHPITAGPDVLVLFSGSGVLAPLLAAARPPTRVLFLDATLPTEPPAPHTVPSPGVAALAEQLRSQHDGDRLPRWTRWWPADLLAELVPEEGLRDELDNTAPELPGDFYTEPVGTTADWEPAQVDYVQLSPAYDAEAAEAHRRGWTVTTVPDAHHLTPYTDPDRVLPHLTERPAAARGADR